MYLPRRIDRIVGFAILGVVVLLFYLVVEVIDRLTASPAMRARVNDGSEKFFAEHGSIWQAASRAAVDRLVRVRGRWF